MDPRFGTYKRKGLLIDTNLRLRRLVGELDPRLIPTFNRTRHFGWDGFNFSKKIPRFFSRIVTLPGILTEISNLVGSDWKGDRRAAFFAKFAANIRLLTEEPVPSVRACRSPVRTRFGLTDSAIILAGKDQYLTITTDAALAGYMERNQLDFINFNNIRLPNWT